MSKYIRTKDGIIDLSKVTIGENGWKNIEEYIAFKQEEQKELIKVADTIEELCDTFVNETEFNILDKFFFYEKDGDCFVNEHDLTLIYERDSVGTRLLKGAIFTDKGLICVAKMNEKGELELL